MNSTETIILGGGAAGTLAAIHLLAAGVGPVTIVERTSRLARGGAYSTNDPDHVLNVPAGRLSVASRAPDDFTRWLGRRVNGADGDSFAPRMLYGDYLAESLLAVAGHGTAAALTLVSDEAVSVSADRTGVEVGLRSGGTLGAGRVVLALGLPAPADPLRDIGAPAVGERYVTDPWAPESLVGIQSGEVLLVGSGLTAVDVALTLARNPVRLHVVSRHGLLPHAHATVSSSPLPPAVAGRQGPARLLHALRAAAADGDWRPVVDGLRPGTQRLWQALGPEGQASFLRHASAYWSVHRHRMAPHVSEQLDELRRSGRFGLYAGRIAALVERDDELEVVVGLRRTDQRLTLRVGHIVNCTGPRLRLFDDPPEVIERLVRDQLAHPDVHGIGLATDDTGALLGPTGTPSTRLFAVGALRRGTLWESTAVPELRSQAEQLATTLVSLTTPATSSARRPGRASARRQTADRGAVGSIDAATGAIGPPARAAAAPDSA